MPQYAVGIRNPTELSSQRCHRIRPSKRTRQDTLTFATTVDIYSGGPPQEVGGGVTVLSWRSPARPTPVHTSTLEAVVTAPGDKVTTGRLLLPDVLLSPLPEGIGAEVRQNPGNAIGYDGLGASPAI